MSKTDITYMSILGKAVHLGTVSENRTGIDTSKTFGEFVRFDVQQGYPIVTQKHVFHRGIHEELFWFLDGGNNIQPLIDKNVHIWDGWANSNGDLGPVYGEQWRARDETHVLIPDSPYFESKLAHLSNLTENAKGETRSALFGQMPYTRYDAPGAVIFTRKYDQIANAIHRLEQYPDCRRIIVDSWNPDVVPVEGVAPKDQPALGKQALPACHTIFQFGSASTGDSGVFRADLSYMDLTTNTDGTVNLFGYPTNLTLDEITESLNVLLDVASYHDNIHGPMKGMRELSLHMHQRSADLFLGFPFNIASYASLLNIMASRVGMLPKHLTISLGDSHVYSNHEEAIAEQHKQKSHPAPIFCAIDIKNHSDLKGLTCANYRIVGYEHGPLIRGDVAI